MIAKELPIFFSGAMVRAIPDGRKTQTRRVVKGVREGWFPGPCHYVKGGFSWWRETPESSHCTCAEIRCPYGVPGHRLWVRETLHYDWQERCWRFAADGAIPALQLEEPAPDRWPRGCCPSIHMPRELARLILEVTGIRIERLQDITPADAKAEGDKERSGMPEFYEHGTECHRIWFRNIWDEINGPGSWEANPWVWIINFKRV